jgi:hypothetical protein
MGDAVDRDSHGLLD